MQYNHIKSPPTTIKGKTYEDRVSYLLEQSKTKSLDIVEIKLHGVITGYHKGLLRQKTKTPDLDKASSFIYMASLLILEKCKALFPNIKEIEEEDGDDDFRSSDKPQLNSKALEEHRKQVQQLSEKLKRKPNLGKDVWRGPKSYLKEYRQLFYPEKQKNQPFQKKDFSSSSPISSSPHQGIEKTAVFHLLKHYHLALHQAKKIKKREAMAKIRPAPILPTLFDFIGLINPHLRVGKSLKMSALLQVLSLKTNNKEPLRRGEEDSFSDSHRKKLSSNQMLYQKVLMFLSLLELCRLSLVYLFQKQDFADIDIYLAKSLSLSENKQKIREHLLN